MTYFYGHLFAAEPEIRAMFPPAMAAQRERLYRTLTATTTPEEELAALGRAHRKFGVRPEHYGAFRASLLATCRHFAAGTAAAASAEAALAAAFDRASAIMTEAAAADSERNPAWWAAEVTEVRSPATDIAVLTLRPGEPLHYLPGQHVSVQTPHWPRLWRRYSIGCAPRADGTITLHVRAVPGGLVSTALVHRTQPGDVLLVSEVAGDMTADVDSGRDVLCLAAGRALPR